MGWKVDEEIPELTPWFPWRYDMAANGFDVPNMKVIVNRSAALLTYWYYYVLQRLDKQLEKISKYPKFCGGYADIFSGVWRDGRASLAPGVWTAGKAISGQNVAVGIVPSPESRTLTRIKVTIKVFRDVHNKVDTLEARQKYEKASVLSLSWPSLVLISSKPPAFEQWISCLGRSSPSKCASPVRRD